MIKHVCGFCKSNKIEKLYDEKDTNLLTLPVACENCGATWEISDSGYVTLICDPQIEYDDLPFSKFKVGDLTGMPSNKVKKD